MSEGEEFKLHEPDEDVAREHLDVLESILSDAQGGYLEEDHLKGASLRAQAATAHSLFEIKALMLSMVMILEKMATPAPVDYAVMGEPSVLLESEPWQPDAEWVNMLAEAVAEKLTSVVAKVEINDETVKRLIREATTEH